MPNEAQSHPEQRAAVEARVLEAIADGKPLPDILTRIATTLEQLVDGWRVSILLLSPDGTTLRHGAAPSLPAAFVQAIDGARAGPMAGSCGTAVHRRSAVIVGDIATDPLWDAWRDVALRHGLRACWSLPVIDHHGDVLATFAVYHEAPARPEQPHLDLMARYAHVVRIALQHDRTQRQMRVSEQWFRSVFRDAAVGLAVADTDGRLTETNLAYRRMVGYDEDELHTLTVRDLTHPDDWAANAEGLRLVMSGEQPSFTMEKRYRRRDGGSLWVRMTVSARRDAAGRVVDTIAIAEDISQRRRDEEGRRHQQQLLQMASRVGRLGAWSYDIATGRPQLSAEALSILGRSATESLDPQAVIAQFDTDSSVRARTALRTCIEQGIPFDEEASLTTPDGVIRWVRVIGEAAHDDSGERVRMQGALMDITDRRQLERLSLRSQRLESLGTLAGGIAHDLNNVLTPIAVGVGLLTPDERDPARRQILALIESSAGRAADMVRQVLAFARGAEGDRVALEPATLIRDVAALLADTLPKQIVLTLDLDEPAPTVQGDQTQLHQVLLNLCVNARDAMPDGGTLRLSVHAQAPEPGEDATRGVMVCLRVEDTGEGITADALDKIFDPFYTTKPIGRGTGLGLATSLGIVRRHGGRIDVTSTPGKGSRFDVVLPASPDAPSRPRPAPPVEPHVTASGTVLLVDDERAVRLVARHVLEAAGYRVVEAADGEQALREFDARPGEFSVVLTDMMMPGMDGPTLVQALRRRTGALPIVGMSGLLGVGGGSSMDASGLSAFLPKPFTPEALRSTLRTVLAERRAR